MTFHYNRKSEKKKRRELRCDQTKAENILWDHLRAKHLNGYKFKRQYSIYAFIIDFCCPKAKLAIEVDGDFHITKDAIEYDLAREEHIRKYGVIFLRFTNDEVYENVESVLVKISQKLYELTDQTSK